jgi:hypothetical protein
MKVSHENHWSARRYELGKHGHILPAFEPADTGSAWRPAFCEVSALVFRFCRCSKGAIRWRLGTGNAAHDRRSAEPGARRCGVLGDLYQHHAQNGRRGSRLRSTSRSFTLPMRRHRQSSQQAAQRPCCSQPPTRWSRTSTKVICVISTGLRCGSRRLMTGRRCTGSSTKSCVRETCWTAPRRATSTWLTAPSLQGPMALYSDARKSDCWFLKKTFAVPAFNTTTLHAKAAVSFALG